MKRFILNTAIAVFPSYCSLFVDPIAAIIILMGTTFVGGAITTLDHESDPKKRIGVEILRYMWCIHIIGIMVSIAFHSLIK